MKIYFSIFALCMSLYSFSQDDPVKAKPDRRGKVAVQPPKAAIDQYRIISIQNDTTYVDTSLTIQSEYKFNYLRTDQFGLLPFSNEGQPYNLLQFSLVRYSPFPGFGHKSKHINYIEANQINYYSVATPLTELYFKSVMEQGQSVDAFITLNTSERLNFSIAYRGLRSLGKYINQLSSIGNFRFTTSYNTLNKRYYANFHYAGQDITNGEHGGITDTNDFESGDPDFKKRARLEVYFRDAKSFMKGKRFFLDHSFRINRAKADNSIYLTHHLNYERKFFEFSQPSVATSLTDENGQITYFNRFGASYTDRNLNDRARYNRFYNKASVTYQNTTFGKFTLFAEDFRYNYYFDKILIFDTGAVPPLLHEEINTIGGQYEYRRNKWRGNFSYSSSIAGSPLSNLFGAISFSFNDKNIVKLSLENTNKLPDHNFDLNQSNYVAYNWYHDFKNEKINTVEVEAVTQWATASMQVRTINDFLFFSNDRTDSIQIVTPKQYSNTINYLSVKLGKEFRFHKFALDNTILYQKVEQNDDVLNVPALTTRNTLYYSNHFFKRALYIQTGITLN
ncbi:MAG TPA: putative porin, partial [Flavobacterium sp.]